MRAHWQFEAVSWRSRHVTLLKSRGLFLRGGLPFVCPHLDAMSTLKRRYTLPLFIINFAMFVIDGAEAGAGAEARKVRAPIASSGCLPLRGTSWVRDAIGMQYVAYDQILLFSKAETRGDAISQLRFSL